MSTERLVYYQFEKEVRIDAPYLRGVTIATCPNERVAEAIVCALEWAEGETGGDPIKYWKDKLNEPTPQPETNQPNS